MAEPRHGTPQGWGAGCKERCCKDAIAAYNRQLYIEVAIYGEAGRRLVSAVGVQRRVQALMLMGWTAGEIARACGWTSDQSVTGLLTRQSVQRDTAQRVDDAYQVLWHRWLRGKMPPMRLRQRNVNAARRKGFLPAAVWDDIDDPAEQPKGLAS